MTANDAQHDRITSRSWVGEYQNECGEAAPAIENASVFTEGGAPEDAVPIPSIDPALRFAEPSSRMSTLDFFPLSSLDSRIGSVDSRIGSVEWFKHIMNAPPAKPAEGISTMDLVASATQAEEEPSLSPEHETEEPSSSVEPAAESKPASKNGREYVTEVLQWDILSERGGKANHHDGNKRYRKVVSEMKEQYRGIEAKTAKTDLSRNILDYIENYGGRFLKKDPKDGRYFVMTKQEARKKTSQALRETKQLKWTQVDGVEDHVEV
jgi:hypothetical protein